MLFVCVFGYRVNATKGPAEDRVLTTGLHTVCDIFCRVCDESVGWFYVSWFVDDMVPSLGTEFQRIDLNQEEAFEASQKYKVGKYILEKAKLSKQDL